MRKVLAVLLSATLLCISSVPASAEVASCTGHEIDVVAMMSGEDMMHHAGHDNSGEEVHLGHDHHAGLSGDWQKDRIECGCGCHRSIDSLPHLLAPHTVDVSNFQVGIESISALRLVQPALLASSPQVPVPPPQFI